MVRLIFYKEWKEIFRTSNMPALLAGMFLLLGLALYNGYSSATAHSRLLRESQETTYRQFISQGDKNPHLGAHFGFYAYKPTADLSMIDNGIEDYTGNSFYLEPHKRGVVRFREVADATGLRSFGFFNVGFFVQFLLPLFIFLICHNVFSKEWENGTIKLVLSSKATARQVFTGKLLACLALVFCIVAVLGLAGLALGMARQHAASFLPAYGTYLLGVSIFCVLMTIIGISVSLLTKSSALSLVVLSGFWLLGVFLVPRLSSEMARQTFPSITSLEFENTTFSQKQYGRAGQGSKDYRRALLADSVMKQYGVQRLEDLPVFFIPITIEYFEESDGQIMDNAYGEVEANEARQNHFVLASTVLSPFLAFRDFSMRVAATDMQVHQDFTAKAEQHRRSIGVIVDSFYQKNTVAGNAFWKTIPQFAYRAPSTGWRLAGAVGSIAALLGWLAAAVALMLFSYRKMTV